MLAAAYRRAEGRIADRDFRGALHRTGRGVVGTLKADLVAAAAGAPGGPAAADRVPDLDAEQRADLLRLVFETCDRPAFVPLASFAADGTSPASELRLHPHALRHLVGLQVPRRHPFAYQADILGQGGFSMPSPFDGEPAGTVGSLLVWLPTGRPLLFYAFQFGGTASAAETVLAIVSPYRGDIVGLLLLERNLIVGVELASKYSRAVAWLKALMVEFAPELSGYLAAGSARRPTLLMGSMDHFGHVMLNEFEALHQLLADGEGAHPRLDGPVRFLDEDAVFPELAGSPRIPFRSMREGFAAVLAHQLLLVRSTCGDYFFSRGLRDRVAAAVDGAAPAFAVPGRWPVVWFEIRSNHRVWLEQASGIASLARELAGEYPDLCVIVAGWSQVDGGILAEQDGRAIERDRAIVREIGAALPPGVLLVDVVGVPVAEKAAWACRADAFVLGFGTGFVFPLGIGRVPGIIHSNSGFMAELVSGDMLSIIEDHAPVHLVEARPENDRSREGHHQTWDYSLDDAEILAPLRAMLRSAPRPGRA